MAIIFDIETVGFELENLSESQQEFLLRYAEKENNTELREQKISDTERYLSLYPFTAKLLSIGMLNSETNGSFILYNSDKTEKWKVDDKEITYQGLSEKAMLEIFWKFVVKTDKVVTFNGRNFDIPFLMMRSAMLKIKPTINLINNRYNITRHIDLLDQFTFYGLTRKFNLDFYCHAFVL